MNTHTARVRVIVRYKPGVLDPQGKTIRNVLHTLGYARAVQVHTGKVFVIEWQGPIDAEARAQIRAIAERVLTNPIIEQYEIEWPETHDETRNAVRSGTSGSDPL